MLVSSIFKIFIFLSSYLSIRRKNKKSSEKSLFFYFQSKIKIFKRKRTLLTLYL
nr:MAG TPA: hypothetical protein [Caudoviricetes sp.]